LATQFWLISASEFTVPFCYEIGDIRMFFLTIPMATFHICKYGKLRFLFDRQGVSCKAASRLALGRW
jgi:hypothetical protein